MAVNRRGFLGTLAATPAAVPAMAKEMAAQSYAANKVAGYAGEKIYGGPACIPMEDMHAVWRQQIAELRTQEADLLAGNVRANTYCPLGWSPTPQELASIQSLRSVRDSHKALMIRRIEDENRRQENLRDVRRRIEELLANIAGFK